MTNAYFDHGQAAPYTGRLAICPECGSAVAEPMKQRHLDTLHPEPIELELHEGAVVPEIVGWDPEDETA